MDESNRIAPLADVPSGGSLLFTIRDGFDREEAILLRVADGVVALKNYCPHWTDVRFDKGSGAAVRGDELVCQKHGATFTVETGFCTHGPCEGATIEQVGVTVADGDVYLTDDDYEFDCLGPSGEHDRSTRGRIDFTGS